MNLEKVVFGFFVLLAATLNFGFFIGDIDDPVVHNPWELYAAVVVNLVATVLKFGDRTQIGAVHLATSLVAVLQLVAATVVVTSIPDRRRRLVRAHRSQRALVDVAAMAQPGGGAVRAGGGKQQPAAARAELPGGRRPPAPRGSEGAERRDAPTARH